MPTYLSAHYMALPKAARSLSDLLGDLGELPWVERLLVLDGGFAGSVHDATL